MCFSAEASFTTGIFLFVLGIKTKLKSYSKNFFISLIPFLFGIQQILEGMNWLILDQKINLNSSLTIKLYTWFEFSFWPFFMPLACMSYCLNKKLKVLNSVFLILGLTHIVYWSYLIFFNDIDIEVFCGSGCGLNYIIQNSTELNEIVYLSLVALPFFFTGNKILMVYSFFTALSFFISKVWFSYAWGSTWCFFAAALSFMVYYFIKTEQP
jgi:hypothetical protein